MKTVLQRVSSASVRVHEKIIGSIEGGLLILVGFGPSDTPELIAKQAAKISEMRLFPEGKNHFHLSVKDSGGGVLVVPQFTLYADTNKGRRPEFFGALEPVKAREFFILLCEEFQKLGISRVERGEFGAHMHVTLVNDGPVTILLEQ